MGKVPVTFVVRFANVVEVVPVPPLAIGSVPVTLVARFKPVELPVPPEATGRGVARVTPDELMVTCVTPAACSARTPEPSPVTTAPPVEVSALIVVAMCYSNFGYDRVTLVAVTVLAVL
jgi:hypothetical protein